MYNTHDDDDDYILELWQVMFETYDVNLPNIMIYGQQTVWERKWILCEYARDWLHMSYFLYTRDDNWITGLA